MEKTPSSSAACATTLHHLPRRAETIAGEMLHVVTNWIETQVLPYVELNAKPHPRPELPPPPKYLVNVSAGVGKTRVAVAAAIKAVECNMRVAISVPTTRLALDIHQQIEKHLPGISGAWLGREQHDPSNPSQKMCPRFDAAAAAYKIGLRPTAACGSKVQGFCKHYPRRGSSTPCAYRQQDLRKKQIVIFAGAKMLELAPNKKMNRASNHWSLTWTETEPQLMMEIDEQEQSTEKNASGKTIGDSEFDLLLIDETDPFSFVSGFDNSPPFVPKNHINTSFSEEAGVRAILNGFLYKLDDMLSETTEQHMSPYLCKEHDGANPEVLSLEILQGVHEAAEEALAEIVQQASNNRELSRGNGQKILATAALLSAKRAVLLKLLWVCDAMTLGHMKKLEPLAHLAIDRSGECAGLQVRRKTELFRRYSTLPTVLFDATGEISLLEKVFGPIDNNYSRSAVDGPGVKRYQLRDETVTYSQLDNPKWPQRIRLFAELLELIHSSVGLVVPLKVEAQIESDLGLNVKILHFGAERGNNSLETVTALVVASRQAKHHTYLEDMVTVLTEAPVERLSEGQRWYSKQEGFITHRDQKIGWPVLWDQHPAPLVECARRLITEAGLEQALARGRNVRRTEGKPLHEYVLTDARTSRLVDGTFTKAEFKAAVGWIGEFLLAGVWVADGKGQGILQPLLRGICSQRRESLLSYIIGDPAFESPKKAAKWRKDQINDNPEIARLVSLIDRKLHSNADSVDLLYAPFPLGGFKKVRAKVRGSRCYANLFVRTLEDETPAQALERLFGKEFREIEVKPE
jgi:hypothetical protein